MTVVTKFDFDQKFQKQILCLLLKDKEFANVVLGTDVLRASHFDYASYGWLYAELCAFYEKYGTIPTSDIAVREIDKSESEYLNDEVKSELKDVARNYSGHIEPEAEGYLKSSVTDFIKYQKVKAALKGSIKLLKEGKFDEIGDNVSNATKAVEMVTDSFREVDFFNDYDKRIKRRFKIPLKGIPTNIIGLDDYLAGGGLCNGELGVVLGPSGRGKSFFLIKLGRSAIFFRKKVIHITLEMSEDKVADRYDQSFLGISKDDLYTAHGAKKLRKFMKTKANFFTQGLMSERLVIKFWPMMSVTTTDIKNYLKRKRDNGFDFDMIVIDYGDVIRPNTSYNNEYADLGRIYHELMGIAQHFDVPLWTASQTNKAAVSKKIVTIEDVADSWRKVHPAHVILALCQTADEKKENPPSMRVFIAKNREGDAEKEIPIKTQFAISTIKSVNKLSDDYEDDDDDS